MSSSCQRRDRTRAARAHAWSLLGSMAAVLHARERGHVRIVEAFTDWCGHALALCPSCPTALEARDAFFTDDVATRLVGMAAPFVVTLGLVKVVLDRLRRRT